MPKKNNKKYQKSLHQQAYEKLNSMTAFGQSRQRAKANGTDGDKIFSYNTYHTYQKHIGYYIAWLKSTHPNVTTLKKARKHVSEWLQQRVDQGLSAHTIRTEQAALNKLFGIKPDDKDYFIAPKREREKIKRSRTDTKQDAHFSTTNNAEIIAFGKGTGLRKNKELAELRGGDIASRGQLIQRYNELKNMSVLSPEDAKVITMIENALIFEDVTDYVYVRNGKGGKARLAPIIGEDASRIASRIRSTPAKEKVWSHIPKNMDEHSYRADYCATIYKHYAREIDDIPFDGINKGSCKKFQRDVYACRKDEKGKKLDKRAMKYCSVALGHNRLSVVADHYLYGI